MSRKKPNPFADLPGELRRAVAADPVATVLSHAFNGTPNTPCRVCTLPFSHPVHAHGKPGNEVAVKVGARSPDLLQDVLGMLEQADSDLTALRPETAQQTLRDAIASLRAEIEPQSQRAYAERVAAQGRRIDARLNEEERKQKRRR